MHGLLNQAEAARLSALRSYEVMDTPAEKDFDDLVRLASMVCGTPIAVISLIDENRLWVKAVIGLDVQESSLEHAFCRYTIEQTDVMVVPDAREDSRFCANPFVTGEPNIRFYAGAPLITPDNHRIGSLCVVDHKVGQLTTTQREALAALSRQVVTQLELRRTVRRLSQTIDQRDAAITRNEQVNQELATRNSRHESMMSALSEGIVIQTLMDGIQAFNPSACRILGLSADALSGRGSCDPRWAAIHEDGTPFPGETHPAMTTLQTGESCSNVIMGLQQHDKDVRWISINTRLLPKADATDVNTVVASFHEVTELLRIQHELGNARDTADAANRAKSQFLANMSHEIRTPMTAILGFADRLQEPNLTQTDRADCVDTIRRNGSHLMKIIDNILDLSKIEAKGMTVERVAIEPVQIVEEVVAMMRLRASERGLNFTVSYQRGIPNTIQSDPTRLRQILLNLVGNAIKFTLRGEVRVEVSIDDAKDGKPRLRFAIVDTGVGMTAEQLTRLFKPFSQADTSTTRQFGGTGLGLAICRGLAEKLDATLEVQSAAGEGSTFTLCIDPGVVTEPARPAFTLRPTQAVGEQLPWLHARILLAEDGPDNQRLISHFLRHAGADVAVAENGQVACDLAMASIAGNARFDLILMDMQMPRMDGYTATRTLRAAGWTGPIIALTAHALADERQTCLTAGCTGFLGKPITRETLIRSVHDALATCVGSRAILRSWLANEPAMADLLQQYIAELPGLVDEIEKLTAINDLSGLRLASHRLRGSGGSYGFPQISDVAGKVEDSIRTNHRMEELKSGVDELVAMLRCVEGYDADFKCSNTKVESGDSLPCL